MKIITIITSVGAAALAALGLSMAVTNPNQTDYEEYAVQQLTDYLKKDVCTKAQSFLAQLIQGNCPELVDSTRPQMRQIIAGTTQRQDFLIFSVYSTELELNPVIPAYRFETVGAFDSFFTYSAEKQ